MFSLISRLKKQKEADREKHRQNEEAAKIYAEYVKSFEGTSDSNTSTFVKSKVYDPATGSLDQISETHPLKSKEINFRDEDPHEKEASATYLSQVEGKASIRPKRLSHGKVREIDTFIEEIKEKQRVLNERKELQKQILSVTTKVEHYKLNKKPLNADASDNFDNTDIYLSNLSLKVTDDILRQHFSQCGTITRVKLINRDPSRSTLSGFISFFTHDQAEFAKSSMDGTNILGLPCKIAWAKPLTNTSNIPLGYSSLLEDGLTVTIPQSPTKRRIIDLMAKYVSEFGKEFEQVIMNKELTSGLFSFLFEKMSIESIYYRWRVYSFLQGDSLDGWRIDPFKIVSNGIQYKPPPVQVYTTERSELINMNINHLSQSGTTPLSSEDRKELEMILSNSTLSREAVCNAMIYIIDHSASAYDVTNILASCILEDTVDINLKIFRLYILSDVLYNSSCSRQFAWIYRTSLERRIPEIFEHIKQFRKRITSKIASQQLLDSALRIIQVWREWIIYPQLFTNGLEAILLGDDIALSKPLPEFELNEHLLTTEDGEPIPFIDLLSKLPLQWRTVAYKYLTMSMKDLKNTCHQHGLSSIPNDRETLVTRLIICNKYWSAKENDDKTNVSEDMDHSDPEEEENPQDEQQDHLVEEERCEPIVDAPEPIITNTPQTDDAPPEGEDEEDDKSEVETEEAPDTNAVITEEEDIDDMFAT